MSEKISKSIKVPFTEKEDEKLTKIVKSFSKKRDINWKFVSQQMETRNARQCKDRWTNYLDSKINRLDFTAEENHFILLKVEELGRKWKKIASLMKNRTDVAVKSQFRKLMRRNATVQNVYDICTDPYSTRRKPKTEQKEEFTFSGPELPIVEEFYEDIFGNFEFPNNGMNFSIDFL